MKRNQLTLEIWEENNQFPKRHSKEELDYVPQLTKDEEYYQ